MNTEKSNNRKGIIASILIHAVLLILFAIFGLSYTIPPPEEEGITINFGFSDQGMLQEESEVSSTVDDVTSEEEQAPTESSQEIAEEEILTQSTEEAPAIEKKVEEKKPVIEKKEEPVPNKDLTKALDKWKKTSNEAGSDGITGNPGNQGDLNGDVNSKNYIGGGSGNGTSFNLAGRNMLSSPKISDNSQKEGKVVVDIIVDRYGNVVRATPGARGSTTSDSQLYNKAKEAALKSKFNSNPDAAEEQKGQMTFIFILN